MLPSHFCSSVVSSLIAVCEVSHVCMQEHVEAGLGGRPEVGVRNLLQLADEEPQAHLTLETQEAARAAFEPAEECRQSMLNLRYLAVSA